VETTVAKSRGPKQDDARRPPPGMVQFSVRIPADLNAELEETAHLLATDRSHLIRIILAENLRTYRARARAARGLEEAE
jgi:hypothetical protein